MAIPPDPLNIVEEHRGPASADVAAQAALLVKMIRHICPYVVDGAGAKYLMLPSDEMAVTEDEAALIELIKGETC